MDIKIELSLVAIDIYFLPDFNLYKRSSHKYLFSIYVRWTSIIIYMGILSNFRII